jgi:hypothetical protein
MRTVTVTARDTFEHDGRQHTAGAPLEVRPVDALVLHRRGHVSLSRVEPAPPPVPASPSPAVEASTRRTRRRDLSAAETPRRYRRRDLVATDPTEG